VSAHGYTPEVAQMVEDLSKLRVLLLRAALAYGKTLAPTDLANLTLAARTYYQLHNDARRRRRARRNEKQRKSDANRRRARVCVVNPAHGNVERPGPCDACREAKNASARDARKAAA